MKRSVHLRQPRRVVCGVHLKTDKGENICNSSCIPLYYRLLYIAEAVLGDILFNGRCNVAFSLVRGMTSHRLLKWKSPKTASRRSEKRRKHSKHTTGKVFRTLFWILGIFHGNCRLFWIKFQLWHTNNLRCRSSVGFVFNQPRNWEKLSSVIAWHDTCILVFVHFFRSYRSYTSV